MAVQPELWRHLDGVQTVLDCCLTLSCAALLVTPGGSYGKATSLSLPLLLVLKFSLNTLASVTDAASGDRAVRRLTFSAGCCLRAAAAVERWLARLRLDEAKLTPHSPSQALHTRAGLSCVLPLEAEEEDRLQPPGLQLSVRLSSVRACGRLL
jgi:hypothetical protein